MIEAKNPNKTKGVRELGPIDISSIREDILNIPEEVWDIENSEKPNKFNELHKARHIVFRFVDELNNCTKYYDKAIWASWKERLQPILDAAVVSYGYEKGEFSRIMLARLEAGGEIAAHKDGDKITTLPHKIHIPIVTNDKVMFFVNPNTYFFKEAHAYEVNNSEVHYTENLGAEDRIHLIFEYFDSSQTESLRK